MLAGLSCLVPVWSKHRSVVLIVIVLAKASGFSGWGVLCCVVLGQALWVLGGWVRLCYCPVVTAYASSISMEPLDRPDGRRLFQPGQ